MKKLWEAGTSVNDKVFNFTVGNDFLVDQALLPYDIKGSIAHAKGLAKIKVLTKAELNKILSALKDLQKLDNENKVIVNLEDEDMHTVIENYLVKKLGNTGKKIHTGRSRNDQVLTAIRLYSKDMIDELIESCKEITTGLKNLKTKYGKIEMAGYTHMQKAMPTAIGTWCQAFTDSFNDNIKLLLFLQKFTDQSPLGTGAGYGVPINLDRTFTAKELGFDKVQSDIYAQNSRGKFESLILEGLCQIMLDINKIASDLILFSMPEFGIFSIPKEFCTGSSIMPQKKNPDVLELLRAKYHYVYGEQVKIKGISGNLISGYNRDTQLIKEAFVVSMFTTLDCCDILGLLLPKVTVSKENAKKTLTDEVYATEKVYDLVKQGLSFRDAYNKVKKNL